MWQTVFISDVRNVWFKFKCDWGHRDGEMNKRFIEHFLKKLTKSWIHPREPRICPHLLQLCSFWTPPHLCLRLGPAQVTQLERCWHKFLEQMKTKLTLGPHKGKSISSPCPHSQIYCVGFLIPPKLNPPEILLTTIVKLHSFCMLSVLCILIIK